MGCVGCTCSTGKDEVKGCKSNGGCATGGCNKRNTFDWLSVQGVKDSVPYDIVEISFKNGGHKDFFRKPRQVDAVTGDFVVVETGRNYYDVGQISLSGELVRHQMRKKKHTEDRVQEQVLRLANNRDLQKLEEFRHLEKQTLIRAREITKTLDLDMKISDVRYQGDGRKATFYYIADGRVDFRELIKIYASDFKVRVEMKQIGVRQESALVGGLGSCGRELCCSTWLTDFRSVNTTAARYQNLAINQAKLSGQCGRLKCCLNFELDFYVEAMEAFPKKADKLKTEQGTAYLVKTDVFKKLMYYSITKNGYRGQPIPLEIHKVHEIIALNKKGDMPPDLLEMKAASVLVYGESQEDEHDYKAVDNVIELPFEKTKKRRKSKRKKASSSRSKGNSKKDQPNSTTAAKPNAPKNGKNKEDKPRNKKNRPSKNRRKKTNKPTNDQPPKSE